MNLLDKTISYISPAAGYRRQAWREALSERSNYDAADISRSSRNWRVINDSAEHMDAPERDLVRARARDLQRNSDVACGVLSAFERNVIGRGISLQARTGNAEFNREAERLWKQWCRAKNCDVTGQQNFTQMLRMALTQKKVDGGILFKKCYTKGGLVPFKLQVLEVDELDVSQIRPKRKGNRVTGGIEYDAYNRPVGYWIKQYSIDGMSLSESKYYDANDIIFYWQKKRASQIREISDLSQTISRVRDANEFINAVSIKERVAACLAVFIKRVLPNGGGFGRGGGGNEKRHSYEGKTLAPGMIAELNAGDELDVVNPANSGSDSAEFLKVQQRMISSGQGLSYEAVSRDMSQTNYSSARQAMIEDDNTYWPEAELLIERVMDEVYETFLISCVLAGLISAPGFWDDKLLYFEHQWVPSPRRWIDPSKEATANKIALTTGQKTFQDICAENGKDWEDQLADMAKAINKAQELGIDLGGILYGKSQGTGAAAGTSEE